MSSYTLAFHSSWPHQTNLFAPKHFFLRHLLRTAFWTTMSSTLCLNTNLFSLKPVAFKGTPSEKLCRAQKPKFWEVSLVPAAVTPSPVFSSYLPRAATSFSSFLSPCGKPKGFTSSQTSSHSILLNSLFIYNIFANRRKLRGGRDCLWIATYMR